jgi:hypothetical protein
MQTFFAPRGGEENDALERDGSLHVAACSTSGQTLVDARDPLASGDPRLLGDLEANDKDFFHGAGIPWWPCHVAMFFYDKALFTVRTCFGVE